MSLQPTRGPWTFDPELGVVTSANGPIAFMSREKSRMWRLGLLKEADANGRAIAALPDLIEALLTMKDVIPNGHRGRVRAALIKAGCAP